MCLLYYLHELARICLEDEVQPFSLFDAQLQLELLIVAQQDGLVYAQVICYLLQSGHILSCLIRDRQAGLDHDWLESRHLLSHWLGLWCELRLDRWLKIRLEGLEAQSWLRILGLLQRRVGLRLLLYWLWLLLWDHWSWRLKTDPALTAGRVRGVLQAATILALEWLESNLVPVVEATRT